jgi:DeoR/GlpR family transcriptional regulator of sugar metabolism
MSVPQRRYEGAERRARILRQLRLVGFLSISELSRDLGVSPMTVRRDLHQLEASGQVRLVHGGASLVPGVLRQVPFRAGEEAAVRTAAQTRIGRRAARLVGDEDVIGLDAGPAPYALARALPESFAGTVVTHSLPVMQLLSDRGAPAHLIALGGEFRPERAAFVGPVTTSALRELRVRTLFLAPAAINASGIYADTPAEAAVQQGFGSIADRVVVLAAAEAAVGAAPALVAPLERIARLVADEAPPPEIRIALSRAAIDLDIEPSPPTYG